MTDTLTTTPVLLKITQSVRYDVTLVVAGLRGLWRPSRVLVAAHGVLGVVLGLLSCFLLVMWVIAIVRGPFYGLVEHGPIGPGTWGGPTRAGAWAVHAAVAVPVIVLIPLALHGIGALHLAVTRGLYGEEMRWWVLPATISIAAAGVVLFVSWLQQI
ncbi:hypothetical protein [Kribbella sp. NPDC051770]|uniref:hypothetical protein n=1 Tax=Kribbella sp. NPDC051770 TaxID=3155413 RepID=UPI0034241C34